MSLARFATVEELLADARSRLERVDVDGARAALATGARFVDIRPVAQRVEQGEIPGAVVVERNHLEWRLHPASAARLPIADVTPSWIVVCVEGYTSSLAADALQSIGVSATDLIGGFDAWAAAGEPVVPGGTAAEQIVS